MKLFTFLAPLCLFASGAWAPCRGFFLPPASTMTGEVSCRPTTGTAKGCTDCCPHGYFCCDDGRCIEADPFCRYPKECCQQALCGRRCCEAGGGVACGPNCAPSDYACCDAATGHLCLKPETCCGSKCCPAGQKCCGDTCCPQSEVCCNGKCCAEGTECCGDHCCLSGHDDVCGSHEACCPSGRECGNDNCCPAGHFCPDVADRCCTADIRCGSSCCNRGEFCYEGKSCCPQCSQLECPSGACPACLPRSKYATCCGAGGGCPSGSFCADGAQRACCPTSHPQYCPATRTCWNVRCQCCGGDGPYGPFCCPPGHPCMSNGQCYNCFKENWFTQVCVGAAGPDSSEPQFVRALDATVDGSGHAVAGSSNSQAHFIKTITLPPNVAQEVSAQNLPPAPTAYRLVSDTPCWAAQIRHGRNNTCQALQCLKEMMELCGPRSYLDRAEEFYCARLPCSAANFTLAGQAFLRNLTECIGVTHREAFQDVFPCCLSIERWGIDGIQKQCFIDSGFCDVYMENIMAFNDLFKNSLMNVINEYFKDCKIGSNHI